MAALGFGKVFIYAKSGRAGRWLIRSVKSANAFRDMVRERPPKGLEEFFWVYFDWKTRGHCGGVRQVL